MPSAELFDLVQAGLLNGLLALGRLVFGPTSRTYWPCLLMSLAIALWLWHRHRPARAGLPDHLNLFSAETWLGRSAMNDYWLVLFNATLFGGLIAALVPKADSVATALLEAAALTENLPSPGPAVWAPIGLALWVFFADDFARFLAHWLEHRVPVLWAFHKVHHSAEAMNFITAERHHPVSLVFCGLVIATVVGAANAAFVLCFGDLASPATLIGANAFWLCANLLGASLRHSPVWWSFGPTLERWLISPAQHQVHHSANPLHFDRNFGSTLALWDRLFGTLHLTGPRPEVRAFGLVAEASDYRMPWDLYLRPLAGAFRPRRPGIANG